MTDATGADSRAWRSSRTAFAVLAASMFACTPKAGMSSSGAHGAVELHRACGEIPGGDRGRGERLVPSEVESSRYPFHLVALPAEEVERRRRIVERRIPGLRVELDRAGQLSQLQGSVMPCSTQAGPTKRSGAPTPDEKRFVQALFDRNRDVLAPGTTATGVWIVLDATSSTPVWEVRVPTRPLVTFPADQPDAVLWKKFPPTADVFWQSCPSVDGDHDARPPCLRKVLATFPLKRLFTLKREMVVFDCKGGFEIRRVASLTEGPVPPVQNRWDPDGQSRISVANLVPLDAITGEDVSHLYGECKTQ